MLSLTVGCLCIALCVIVLYVVITHEHDKEFDRLTNRIRGLESRFMGLFHYSSIKNEIDKLGKLLGMRKVHRFTFNRNTACVEYNTSSNDTYVVELFQVDSMLREEQDRCSKCKK